jgi:stage III sporulation protein AA
LLSGGVPQVGFYGVQVGVVDERSEIGACRNGIPTTDLGCRVDVLDGCCKAQGLLMLIRSMSPQVVVTDELGRQEDVYAIREALTAGISVIATMHGKDLEEILHRPYVGELIQNKYFDRHIILGNTPFPGSVEAILDKQRTILYSRKKGDKLCG